MSSTWLPSPAAAVCTETPTTTCAMGARRELLLQQSERARRNRFRIAINLVLPWVARCTFPGIYKQRNKTFFFFNYEGHREHNDPTTTSGTVPTPAFRTGDFSALLGPQIGTDALGRPILSGQIYDPYSTRPVTARGFIRDPVPADTIWRPTSRPFTGASLINSIGQTLINFYPTPLNSSLTNNWSAIGLAGQQFGRVQRPR